MRKRHAGVLAIQVSLLLSLLVQDVHAQHIEGIVKDGTTLQPLISCNLTWLNSGIGAVTDGLGRFSFPLPKQDTLPKLVVSFQGYESDTVLVEAGKWYYTIILKISESQLNDVVVTGVSKATLRKENPVAISTVSSKAIETTTESNIIDVLAKNVAGLNAVKTGPNISKPFIRGLGYNRVLTLYDGIRQEGQQWGDEHGIEADAYNINKAEVVKGPASIMYGSDAVAGVVSLIPQMPTGLDKKLNGKVYSEYQSNNGLVGNGMSLNFTKNSWSFGIRGSHRIAKNYTNQIDGRVYNTGFREINASSTVQHFSKSGFSNLNLTLYDNLQGIPDGSRDSATRKFTKQIFEGTNDDLKDRPIVPLDQLNGYALSPLHQHIQHYRIYTNNHYKAGSGEFDFLFAIQQNIRREYNHPTATQQAGLFVRLNTLNYGIRYTQTIFSQVEISAGVNGMGQINKSLDATDFPIPDYQLSDIGSYLYAKWKIQKLSISGGLRYDDRHLQGGNFYTEKDPVTGFSKKVVPPGRAGAYLQFASFDKIFNGTSLSIGATFVFNDHYSIKVNLAKGYRAPGITEFASNGLDPGAHIIYLGNRNFIPEFNFQEDIGADIRFKEISVSVSVFNNNIEHYIYLSQLTDATGNAVVDAQGNKTYQYKQARARLFGLEASMSLHPESIKGLSFDNSFSMVYGINENTDYRGKGIDGEYLPLIPPVKLLSSVSKEFTTRSTIFSLFTLKGEMDFTAVQNRFLALNNSETATPGYLLLNFSLNTTVHPGNQNAILLNLQVNNLLDKTYQSHLSRLKYFEYYTNSPNGHQGIFDMGRNICIKTIVSF